VDFFCFLTIQNHWHKTHNAQTYPHSYSYSAGDTHMTTCTCERQTLPFQLASRFEYHLTPHAVLLAATEWISWHVICKELGGFDREPNSGLTGCCSVLDRVGQYWVRDDVTQAGNSDVKLHHGAATRWLPFGGIWRARNRTASHAWHFTKLHDSTKYCDSTI
jgi:hypothetical protein